MHEHKTTLQENATPLSTTNRMSPLFSQRFADLLYHFLCGLTGWNHSSLCLLHGGESTRLIHTHFNFFFILMLCSHVQLASCTLNKFFISSTLILSVLISIVAILPWVQKGMTVLSFSFFSSPSPPQSFPHTHILL